MADLTVEDDLALGPPYALAENRGDSDEPEALAAPAKGPLFGKPITLSKDQIDLFYERFGDSELRDAEDNVYAEGPDAALASSLVRQFARENPAMFPGGYENLVKTQQSGEFKSHPLWAAVHGPFENLKDKPISDVDIINLFARNEEGQRFEEGTFFGGMKREIGPSVFSMSGAVAAGKTASRLTAPIPATTPVTAAIKFGVPLVAAVGGGLTGYKVGEEVTDFVLGEEQAISPGTRVQYEMGKTAASGLGWLPTPYLISSKVNLGGAEYLTNLAEQRAKLLGSKPEDISLVKPKSSYGFRLQDTTVVPYLKGTKYVQDQGPRAARMVRFAENMLSATGKSAKIAPIPLAAGELSATAGATVGTGIAESQYPGEALPRIGFELLFGTPFGLAGAGAEKAVAAYDAAKEGFKNYGGIKGILKAFSVSRQNKGAQRIVEILEGQGYKPEDIETIAQKLAADDIDDMLVDSAGKKISLTAGTKSGDPVMMAIEASIAQSSPTLGRARDTAAEETANMIRNQINALVLAAKGGDQALNQAALQELARVTQSVFARGMVERLGKATDNALAAVQRVKGQDIDNAALGRQLFNVVDTQMELARRQEKALWAAVPDIEITTFRNADGEEVDVPNFISAWDNAVPRTKEARDEVDNLLSPLAKFVERKRKELNLDRDPMPELDMGFQRRLSELRERTQGLSAEAAAREIKAEQDTLIRVEAGSPQGDYFQYLQRMMDDPAGEVTPLTLVEVQDMRQKALSLGRRLRSSGDDNEARIAYAFAEGLLDDLDALEAVADASYQTARSYSRALNDTFTRTFAGDILGTAKTGEARIAPELLANRVLAGGVDPTLLRVNQLKNIATFMRTEGVPGATPEETLNTVSGSIEDMLRNVRAEAYREVRDPETGAITPRIDETALRGWLEKNKELLGEDGFAALRRDLEDSEKAEVILRQTQLKNKKRTKRLNSMKVFQDILPQTTDSPIHAVGDAINGRAPVRDLNRLVKLASNKNFSESQREAAKEGIKASILEYASVKSGLSSGAGDARTMYKVLFTGMKGSPSNMSPVAYMKSKGLMTDSEAQTMKTFLTELARVETAAVKGNLVDIAKEMGPMVDFYVSIAGSAAGTRAYTMMTGGQSGPGVITAASRGQEFLRQIFSKVPESLKMDVMGELMTNPKLLADLLRKTPTQREKIGLLSSIKEQFQELGFIRPVRRELGSAFREADDEIDQQIIESELEEQSSAAPTVMPATQPVPAQRVAPPTSTLASATLPPPTATLASATPPPPPPAAPAPSGPVNRQQYAALFPNDLASGMIRQQGIGSLV